MSSPLVGREVHLGGAHAGVRRRGCTVLLRGEAGSGRGTMAAVLAERLRAQGHQVEDLTGPEAVGRLAAPGESPADPQVLCRLGFVAALLARHQVSVLCPGSGHDEACLREVRAVHEQSGAALLEVYVARDPPPGATAESLLERWPQAYPGCHAPDVLVLGGQQMLLQGVAAIYGALVERRLA